MKQFLLTPAAGKRVIGLALAAHPAIQAALSSGTLVIVAGTTNGYVAEEILKNLGQADGFSRKSFFRVVVLPPGKTTAQGRLPDESGFPGDVVIAKGVWQKGKSIFDVADDMSEGDVILKGPMHSISPAARRLCSSATPKEEQQSPPCRHPWAVEYGSSCR